MFAKQRVNGIVVKVLYKLFKLFGYRAVYYALYLVVAYYFLFAKDVKQSLQGYYEQIGKEFNNKIYFNHLFYYAVTMSDRFISKTDPKLYNFENYHTHLGSEVVQNGVVFVSTHFGGWASATNYFRGTQTKINVVMNESMQKQTQNFYKSLDLHNEEEIHIIDLSQGISASIGIANALLNKECVAMMADRAYRKRDLIATKFFNKDAYFNKNPFVIAYKAQKDLLCYLFALKAPRNYETFTLKIVLDQSLDEDEAVQKALGEYVSFLENIVTKYPQQWFNFYDFWSSDGISYQ